MTTDVRTCAAPAVPWWTVVSLAVLMAYADGFWIISLRGAVGSIERTPEPFADWLRESTTLLPVFVLAVIAAFTLALRWFGPVCSRPRMVVATGLLVAAAGTLAGIAETAASSARDYQLQLQLLVATQHTTAEGALPLQGQASLGLQLGAIGYGAGILLVSNLAVVGWAVAIRGGRLDPGRPRGRAARAGRIEHRRLLLSAALFGCAAIHAAVVPGHLGEWAAAGAFFILLAAEEVAVGVLVIVGWPGRAMLPAIIAVSIAPLAVWLWSRTFGLPFGPAAGAPEAPGLPDAAAAVLELATLLAAVVLFRDDSRPRGFPLASAHLRSLPVVAVIAVGVLGLAGTSPAWFDSLGSPLDESVTTSHR
ncbi:hypothetical protein LVY72_09365 [Arthrobacter sp. I2-34]|uniref:Integral membrane protein n=1 Tax=Arthrobacter hankyongi TaxID=2904801 RepID=A0ABS9L616_9MICC|nr:hypothetical protein [Arthrobacter hankyongi]MCG2622126.1 hypothetical protein [Arthrobacter hankyongi]